MDPALLLAIGFGVVFLAVFWIVGKRQARQWIASGESVGLSPEARSGGWGTPRFPDLVGRKGSREVRLRTFTTGAGKSRKRWTTIAAALPTADARFELTLTREGLATKLGKLFGMQDVEVGDPDFDREFRVRAADPEAAKLLLAGGIRGDLLAAAKRRGWTGGFRDIAVKGSGVELTRAGLASAPGEIEEDLRLVTSLAQAIEKASSPRR